MAEGLPTRAREPIADLIGDDSAPPRLAPRERRADPRMASPLMSETREPETFSTKQAAREYSWRALREASVARFPFPIAGRIPNFSGAERAADRLFELEPWASARTLKCNPDSPQRPVREAALRRGTTVLVPTPRLTGGFMRLDPSKIPADKYREASMMSKVAVWSEPVSLDEIPQLDGIVCGSVAVTTRGERCGKGHGFADLENAILHELGHVPVPIATTVHELQIVGGFPTEATDVRLQAVVTPSEIHLSGATPTAELLDASRLTAEDLERMPVVAAALAARGS